MKFVIFRHGEKSNESHDPSLNIEGFKQAENALKLLVESRLPRPSKIYTSPKIRTQQTLKPIADFSKLKLNPTPLLDLRQNNETPKDFRLRVQEFLVGFQLELLSCVYICTHQDWIEEFLSIIESSTDLTQSKYNFWPSGQYMVFEKDEIWDLLEYKRI